MRAPEPSLEPLLVRIPVDFLRHAALPGEADPDPVRRWLGGTEVGRCLDRYVEAEVGLPWMAANRLNLLGNAELREMAAELTCAAKRLQSLRVSPATACSHAPVGVRRFSVSGFVRWQRGFHAGIC